MKIHTNNFLTMLALFFLATLFIPDVCFATGTGMPWESTLNNVLNSITGPVAKAVSVIAITVFGLALAFGEGGSGLHTFFKIVLGLSIAFAATSFFLSFFGFAGGVAIG